jgi:hypothetical protein
LKAWRDDRCVVHHFSTEEENLDYADAGGSGFWALCFPGGQFTTAASRRSLVEADPGKRANSRLEDDQSLREPAERRPGIHQPP